MPGILELLATASTLILGSSSLFTLALRIIREFIEKREALAAIAEDRLQTALGADDLDVLAEQIRESLAEVSVYQYATDSGVRLKVNDFLEAVQDYVGVSEEIESEPPEEPRPESPLHLESVSPELRRIAREISTGEPWNALARLRRHIEVTLKQIAGASGLEETRRPAGVGNLVNRLRTAELIDSELARDLTYAVSVSNRAVHGIDVSESEAQEAFRHAATALGRLRKITEKGRA